MIAVLNYFEYVSATYEKNVADREMIEDSFKLAMTRWYGDLAEFIRVAKEVREGDPWPPLTRVINYWEREELRERSPTGRVE